MKKNGGEESCERKSERGGKGERGEGVGNRGKLVMSFLNVQPMRLNGTKALHPEPLSADTY